MVRQFLYDAYELALHQRLREGAFGRLPTPVPKSCRKKSTIYATVTPGWSDSAWARLSPIGGCKRHWIHYGHMWGLFVESADAEILVKADYFPALASVQAHWGANRHPTSGSIRFGCARHSAD